MLRVAVPNKGALSETAQQMLAESGYRRRHDGKDLTVLDDAHGVEFFFLRPKDIATYVGSGDLDLGITGRDLAWESGAPPGTASSAPGVNTAFLAIRSASSRPSGLRPPRRKPRT